ncbi:unnamed protein product [Cylicocyclus nassatus]|uniref:Uncharacterized protein n=1 Tax=Cylicocyclus nassatus TaxID=53992 RepID=A0AA36GZK3_CYLNA|nr:unnamed protein product [Cylicocyclus nassatus]
MLKNLVSRPRRQTRPRVEIIHPMDSFSTPPSTQSDAMSTIRLKLSKFSSRGRKTGSICFVSSSMMDSLPDPPYLSVQKLPELFRKNEPMSMESPMVVPTAPPRLTSDSLPSPEYLNLQPIARTRKSHPRIENLFATDPPLASSAASNMETTSFIEEVDVATLLTTQSMSRQYASTSHGHTHTILIEAECEFSTAKVQQHSTGSTYRTTVACNPEEIAL